ncbi:flagellar basal-body MS-ring/collar protein FliF [Paenibacillus aurantius]|uniref:Flagellar M-ring protein n=1 Tax=Paenibacillus aurantius TaxID=2918900 RepID=A0AA96LKG7_9BACL|nr:flagellar basal-body MS-ring/collar protein FliF [Paenibacillus aurantius]WNQ13730.1 flagellar basal-body MS-ring/collar protein FliF [Paenibacillus aurantius]
MNESILQYWNRAKQFWASYTKTQKMTLLATVLLLAVSIPWLIYYFSKTEYALAFTDLQPNDAAGITKYLDSSKIPYILSPDGKEISVPRSQVADVKINVVSQGLNKNGSIGYESLKDSPFGSTDNEWGVKKLSMVQGELQQMLNSFEPVAGSKVMITMPEKSVFVTPGKEAEQSSAAVVLQIKPGYELDQQKIDTMYSLVSKSIKNLPVDNITISEQNGELLPYSKSNGAATASTLAASQFQIKKQLEQDIQKNVSRILGGILGPGKVIPMVTASINFDKKHSTRQTYSPVIDQKGIERSVQEIQKSYSSDGGTTGGTPGTGQTDVPNYPGASSSGKSTSEEVQNIINYEVNQLNEEIDSNPFVINDLTISVGVEPPEKTNSASLTPDTTDAIKQLLANVISSTLANNGKTYTDEDLLKKVTVFNHAFAGPANTDVPNPTNWYLLGGIGLAALALAGAGGFFLSRRRRSAEEENDLPASSAIEYPTVDLESVTNDNQVRKQLETLAKKKPEEFVNLLRTWLVDE